MKTYIFWLGFFGCIGILTTSCHDQVADINKELNMQKVRPDTAYILALEKRYFEKVDKMGKNIVEDFLQDTTYILTDRESAIKHFATVEEYILLLSQMEVEHSLASKPFEIHRKNKDLVDIWSLSLADIAYMDSFGRIAIGDTLYTSTRAYTIKTSIKSGTSDTLFRNTFQGKSRINNTKDLFWDDVYDIKDELLGYQTGSDNTLYEVRAIYGNQSITDLGVRRAWAGTEVVFREATLPNASWNGALYSKFARVQVKVSMRSRYTILFKGCEWRTNSSTHNDNFVSRTSGRCPESGPESWHWVTLFQDKPYSYIILDNSYVQ